MTSIIVLTKLIAFIDDLSASIHMSPLAMGFTVVSGFLRVLFMIYFYTLDQ